MALKEVKTRETFRLQDFANKTIRAYYTGTTETEGEYGPNIRHEFYSPEKKEKFSFWGVTDMNVKLGNVKQGTLVEFTYKGKEKRKLKSGIKEMHIVDVLNDPEDCLKDLRKDDDTDAVPKEDEVPF
ncbi:MAG: hypothetical protein LC102_11715 [Ignavibacteriales bacterium]|nr:hypothetical protein [Ignavibacteriales bacterium]